MGCCCSSIPPVTVTIETPGYRAAKAAGWPSVGVQRTFVGPRRACALTALPALSGVQALSVQAALPAAHPDTARRAGALSTRLYDGTRVLVYPQPSRWF